jgi:short-subunit dehydrogenase
MNKIILISGGSDGIGKALAKSLHDSSYKVVILSRDPQRTESAAEEIGCDYIVADVSDITQVKSAILIAIERYGHIDCLVNNAGVWIEGELTSYSQEKIQEAMDVNALGTIALTREVVPHMKEKGFGRIINVISQAGLHAKKGVSVYDASKWAVRGFTESLVQELAPDGILVSALYPAKTKTDLFEKAGKGRSMDNALEVEDVVRAIRFIIESPDTVIIPELGLKHKDA